MLPSGPQRLRTSLLSMQDTLAPSSSDKPMLMPPWSTQRTSESMTVTTFAVQEPAAHRGRQARKAIIIKRVFFIPTALRAVRKRRKGGIFVKSLVNVDIPVI